MALLFAEKGLSVSLNDPDKDAMDKVKQDAEKQGLGDKISQHSGMTLG